MKTRVSCKETVFWLFHRWKSLDKLLHWEWEPLDKKRGDLDGKKEEEGEIWMLWTFSSPFLGGREEYYPYGVYKTLPFRFTRQFLVVQD